MLGELNYDRVYLEMFDKQHFSTTNFIMLLLFTIIMPILLMNLLVGLAIGDLMQIQQNARLKRLAMQVSFSKLIAVYSMIFQWIGSTSYEFGKKTTQ
jgi:transient receptor potential cation channel subfamily A protein 1